MSPPLPQTHHLTVVGRQAARIHTAEPCVPTRTCLSSWLQSMFFWVGVARFGIQLVLGPLLEGSIPTLTWVHVKSMGMSPIPQCPLLREGHCPGGTLDFPLPPQATAADLGSWGVTAVREQGVRRPPMEQMGTGKLTLLLPQRTPRCFVSQVTGFTDHSSHWSLRSCCSHVEPAATLSAPSLNHHMSLFR